MDDFIGGGGYNSGRQTQDQANAKKWMKIVGIILGLLLVAAIGLICLMYYIQTTELKITVDGKSNTKLKNVFIFEGDQIYIPIRVFASYVGYESYSGDYKQYEEDTTKCYVQSQNEVASFSLGSNKIYKTLLDNNNNDYEYFEILMPMYHTQKKIIKNTVTPEDLVVISGGGWMGNLWIHNECVIREIVQNYPNNKIIILPQTVYYTSDELGEKEYRITNEILKKHSNLHIFVRERKSYNFIKQKFEFTGNSDVYLVPDMVLYGKNIITKGKCTGHEKVINVCIREDCESEQENIDDFYEKIKQNYNIRKVSTVIKSPVVLRKRIGELQKSWETFANAEITITDRLHAMLFSVLNGTPCIVLNNKTGKVFGVADWLDDTNMIVRADSLSEVLEKLKRTTIWKHKKYDREKLLNYFEKMAEVIRKD